MNDRKPHYHHGDLARALVEAGLAVVEAEGVAALSLRELARRTQVTPAAVYRHFADKDALLAAIAAEGFALLNAAFDDGMAGSDDPRARLRAQGLAYVAFALARPGLYRLMFGASRPAAADARLDAESGKAYHALGSAVAACFGAGASEASVTAATIAAWSLVHGYVMLRLEGHLAGVPPEALPDTAAILDNLVPEA